MATDKLKFSNRIKKYIDRKNKQNSMAFDSKNILSGVLDEAFDSTLSFSENISIAKEYIRTCIPELPTTAEANAEGERMRAEQQKEREAEADRQRTEQQQAIEKIKQNENPDLEKYFFQHRQLIKALRSGDFNGIIFLGKAGLGKSYCVETEIPENELIRVQAHITPLELVNLCHDNGNGCKGKVIFFDDVANILENPLCLGILKSMLWSVSGNRKITYKSTQNRISLPPTIEFFGKVIIASNKENITSPDLLAVFSRCLIGRFEFNNVTLMELLTEYAKTLETTLSYDEKMGVVTDFLMKRKTAILNLNFRLVKHLILLREYCKINTIEKWQEFLTSQLEIKDEVKELYRLLQKKDDKTACQEWQELTNMSRRQYYYLKKKYWSADEKTSFALTETAQQQASMSIVSNMSVQNNSKSM